jgi:acyl dehydratase
MKFAEFFAGQQIDAGSYELSKADSLEFARAYDPQWFHTDPIAAQQGPFDGLIASGWQTCGIAMRLAVDQILHDSESFASPGVENIRWPHPVRPGDTLSLRVTVLEVRRSNSKPHLGILTWRWQLFNGEAKEVLDMKATNLFNLATP